MYNLHTVYRQMGFFCNFLENVAYVKLLDTYRSLDIVARLIDHFVIVTLYLDKMKKNDLFWPFFMCSLLFLLTVWKFHNFPATKILREINF